MTKRKTRLEGSLVFRPNRQVFVNQSAPSFVPCGLSETQGSAISVRRNKVELFSSFIGLASASSAEAISRQTNFRLASVTKQFTAALILGLVGEKALKLDDRLGDWLLEVPDWAAAVSLKQLLQHTSGLPDYEDLIPEGRSTQITDEEVPSLLHRANGLFFRLGTEFRYSNTGYVLLGLIAAKAAGLSLSEAFRVRLFQPLGMLGTVAYRAGVNEVPHRAHGHTVEGDTCRVTDQSITSATLGDGGVYSSIEDLTRWCAALDAKAVPHWPEVSLAFEPLVLPSGEAVPYGMGWEVRTAFGRRIHSHSGDTMGFRNFIARFPDDGLSVICLTNRSTPIPGQLLDGLLTEFLPGWKPSPESLLLCEQIVGLPPLDRHARPHLESRHAP